MEKVVVEYPERHQSRNHDEAQFNMRQYGRGMLSTTFDPMKATIFYLIILFFVFLVLLPPMAVIPLVITTSRSMALSTLASPLSSNRASTLVVPPPGLGVVTAKLSTFGPRPASHLVLHKYNNQRNVVFTIIAVISVILGIGISRVTHSVW